MGLKSQSSQKLSYHYGLSRMITGLKEIFDLRVFLYFRFKAFLSATLGLKGFLH